MRINKFDFEAIEQVVTAAKNLQWANKPEDCKRILKQLALEIISDDNSPNKGIVS